MQMDDINASKLQLIAVISLFFFKFILKSMSEKA